MPAFAGNGLYVTWVWSGGTVVLNTDYQTFNYTPSIDFYDQTAGNDTTKTRIAGLKDGAAEYKGLMQAGDLPNWGSAFALGNFGTIVFCPEGTAAGKYAGTVPALVSAFPRPVAYNSLVEANVSWLQNGAFTEGVK
jgi:hypothetical protein